MKPKFTRFFASLVFSYVSIAIVISNPSKSDAQNLQTSKFQFPTLQDLELEQKMLQGLQYCGRVEVYAKRNPNNYQARSELRTCMLLIQRMGFCQNQKVIEQTDFYSCYQEFSDFRDNRFKR